MKHITQEKNYSYVTFDDIQTLTLAKNNPIGFINNLKMPVIIDEIQRAPEVFLPIKKHVDDHRIAGQFALTGSANPLLIPSVGDSLAGRMEIFYLYPLSQGELENKKESFIDTMFGQNILNIEPQKTSRENIYQRIFKGGFPPVQAFDEEDQYAWFSGYVTSMVERDVKDLASITDLIDIPKLLNIVAARVSVLVNFADLVRESTLVTTTLRRYLAMLQTLYIIQFNLPWAANIGLRFVKSPKLYFTDTGLLSFVLRVTREKSTYDSAFAGKMLENFVVSELRKQISWNSTSANMYHFRDHAGSEVDIILEDPLGRIVGIEVKNTETVRPQDFKGLMLLQEKMKDRFLAGCILYQGSSIIPAANQVYAVPISALWS